MSRRRVGILVFPEVELLDFCGPLEVFSVVRLDESKRREEDGPYEVVTVAEFRDAIRGSSGPRFLPDFRLDDCPNIDVLVVPGGWGVRPLLERSTVIDWIRDRAGKAELVTSVCTGSWLLARAGLLDGRNATTHWMRLEMMQTMFPAVQVVSDLHVVEDGAIVTSAGISAGIDLALRVVARHHGEVVARGTAAYMEYPYPDTNARRVSRAKDDQS